MIRFEGKIEFQDTNGIEITKIQVFSGFNNISLQSTEELTNTLPYNYTSSRNPFIIGSSKLNGNATFSRKEQFIIGNSLSVYDSNSGNYVLNSYLNVTITFNIEENTIIEGYAIKVRPTIIFDSINKAYPPTISIIPYLGGPGSNIDYVVDNYIYTFPNDIEIVMAGPSKGQLSLRFATWSQENRPIRIEAIYLSPAIKITKSSLKSFERNLMCASSQNEVSYGLISNSAKIELFDIDGKLKTFAEQDIIIEGFPIIVYLVDTLTGKSQRVLKYYATDFNYNNDDFSFSVSMSDKLDELQNYDIDYIYIPKNTTLGATLGKFLENTKYYIFNYNVNTDFSDTTSNKEYIYGGTVWDCINQLCVAYCTKAYINEDSYLVFRKMV